MSDNFSPPNELTPEKVYQFVGGVLCLDFCNTVGGKRETIRREFLHSYWHFISWCRQASILSQAQADVLRQEAERNPGEASKALLRTIKLREAIYGIFLALSHEEKPAAVDLEIINAELSSALGRLRVCPVAEGKAFEWSWASEELALDFALGPLAHSAANLLTASDGYARVRQCHGHDCGWLFIDSSRNHSRCWCDMRDCGNRAKVRRHRQKQRGA